MTVKERENLYNTFKTNIRVKELESIEIDLKKSYNFNKKKILDSIENTISTGKRGSKYFKSKGGIWCIYGKNINGEIEYFDVAETSSICQEMIKFLQFLTCGKRDVRKNIYKNFERKVYTRFKAQQIYKTLHRNKILYFVVLEYNEDKNERINREIQYAYKLKASWWSPSPKQNKILKGY